MITLASKHPDLSSSNLALLTQKELLFPVPAAMDNPCFAKKPMPCGPVIRSHRRKILDKLISLKMFQPSQTSVMN